MSSTERRTKEEELKDQARFMCRDAHLMTEWKTKEIEEEKENNFEKNSEEETI